MGFLSPKSVFAFAGRNGPAILAIGVLVGVAFPALANAAKPFMGVAVFIFSLGAFLKVDLPTFRAEVDRQWRQISLILLWSILGVPFGMFGLIHGLRIADGALAEGLLLNMLAPPVGSAAAVAAMLGLSAPLALLTTIVATLLAPFMLPPLAMFFSGQALHIDPFSMAGRLVLVVGGACLAATLLRRFCGRVVADNPHAMTGVSVFGLILVAIGAMHGIRDLFMADPAVVVQFLIIAFAVNIAFQTFGAALFLHLGRIRALTVGLTSGNRNVTLIWAAAGPNLAAFPHVELYLAMSVFPIFMLPLLLQAVNKRLKAAEHRHSLLPGDNTK